MKRKLANILYKVLRPHIEIEWGQEIADYQTFITVRLFGKIVSKVHYSPDMRSIRERMILED